MAKLKALLKSVFDSPYLDKADVAYVLTSVVILFKLNLPVDRQAALVAILTVGYVIVHKITNAMSSKEPSAPAGK